MEKEIGKQTRRDRERERNRERERQKESDTHTSDSLKAEIESTPLSCFLHEILFGFLNLMDFSQNFVFKQLLHL